MDDSNSIEKNGLEPPLPCPFLPAPNREMSYRDLRLPLSSRPEELFVNACRYANYLWLNQLPGRAILALCRAIYLDATTQPPTQFQPYRAYVWFLKNYQGAGFLGNPRVSFAHQATRIPGIEKLKIQRAWGLWHLSVIAIPGLPPDPNVAENAPDLASLYDFLEAQGFPHEGREFRKAVDQAREP